MRNLKKSCFLAGTYLLFMLILMKASAYAESPDFVCMQGKSIEKKEAQVLLEKVQSRYNQVNNLKADFTQISFLEALETSEISSGKLYFSKPGRMKWEYQSPEKQIFLLIDKTLWFYQELDKQLVIDHFSKFLISDLPVAFVLGIGDLSSSFDIEEVCLNSSSEDFLFKLNPKSLKIGTLEQDQRLNKFELVANKNTFLPAAARIYDIASNVNTFFLEDMNVNSDLDASTFSSSFPSGIDIDDSRKG